MASPACGGQLAAGALAQLNAMSLVGRHGDEAQAAAFRLVAANGAEVVSSDAHGPTRPPALGAAERALREHGCGAFAAHSLTRSAGIRLLSRGVPGAARIAA
jgi:tyrosine-protein phosphatase YwqE